MSELADRIEQLRRFAEQDPSDALTHFSLGRALLDADLASDAIASLQRVIALDPNISKAYQLLASAELKLGKKDLAVQTLTNGYRVAHQRGDLMVKNEIAQMLKDAGAEVPNFDVQSDAPLGADSVRCKRCLQAGQKLEKPPFRNEFGQQIFDNICRKCWKEAIAMGTKVINELRLPMSDPQAHKLWDQHIREFLNLR